MKRFFVFAALSVAAGLALSGCHDQTNAPPNSSQTNSPASAVTQAPPPPASPASPPAKLVIYVLNPKATGDEDLLVPRTVALHHPEAPAKDALSDLLQTEHSPIAPGTALRGLSVDSGLATVDFSRSPVDETGGESAQSAAMNALAMTLGQFPEISTYQIRVRGRAVKAFGEFTTDGPMDVIRPGTQLQAKGSDQ